MSEVKGLLRSFVLDLRWLVPLGAGPLLALWAFDVGGMRDMGAVEVLAFCALMTVVLGPLVWTRFGYDGPRTKPFGIFFGLACLWAAVSGALLVGLVSLVE